MAIYIDDRELVAAHRAGDDGAFDELVREHRGSLLAHAHRKLRCDVSAEDALQETLVRAYKALPRFNGEYRLGPWLHRIMHNVCIDEAVRRRRDGEKTDKLAAEPTGLLTAPSVEDELRLDFDDSQLQSAFEELSDPYREALVLRFIDELEYDQVARLSGVSEQNARARVSRARSAMRAVMKGVAALPIFLFGFLKRGEKAAAAATSGGVVAESARVAAASTVTAQAASASAAMPVLAEAGLVAAKVSPVVVPVVAKAALGLGLATAVLAPTSDSALHEAVDSVMEAPKVEETVVIGPASLTEAALQGSESVETADGLSIVRTPTAFTPSADEVPSQLPAIDSSRDSHAPEDVLTDYGSISSVGMDLIFDGANRYIARGDIVLQLGDVHIQGILNPDASWLRFSPTAGDGDKDRFDGDLFIESTSHPAGVPIRLSGFAEKTGQGYLIKGLFRIHADSLNDFSGGFFDGSIEGPSPSASSPMELRLTP